jgi:hypothetical protein
MHPSGPDLTSLSRRALMLPRITQNRTPPLRLGGLRCWHVSHGPPWAVGCRNKERHSWNGIQQGLHVPKTRACYRGACKMCGQPASSWPSNRVDMCYSIALQCCMVQLTTHGHGWQGLWPDRMVLCYWPNKTKKTGCSRRRQHHHQLLLAFNSLTAT